MSFTMGDDEEARNAREMFFGGVVAVRGSKVCLLNLEDWNHRYLVAKYCLYSYIFLYYIHPSCQSRCILTYSDSEN